MIVVVDPNNLGPFFHKFVRGMHTAADKAGIPLDEFEAMDIKDLRIRMTAGDYRKLYDELNEAAQPPGSIDYDVFRKNDDNIELVDDLSDGQVEFEFRNIKQP